ncbi:fatty-acid--CoA ligase [Deinococcus metallilatus]|uniref:Fatty-acid--CoA ligase n=1 Tax=Deinococcus metallilatus TaxID=1211322 RepID=A0AAJ5F1Z7_9DEIO|nr:AMP-binding protein [Deinococcus metallilatus]MBB5297168.1 fatty-acyl-CoA synthase [Deinococcus metallilatus]QBY10048.1 fatty-acid--CoA ligase [Deinococcus metallilatus]RXJ08303.1 fatty-acid--CoA ligase [Deinococcus metallilatus]TLK21987.1 fatty-acid--CoA ligase [Deinococcus metallilatus]GMA17267.1 fatty-acid--CoA ligase [Deinococcus metallilatus]
MNTPLTPLDLIRRGLKTYPDRLAVTQPGGPSFTYRAWGERIFRLARAVREAVPPGSRVAVLSPNTHEGLLTYAAVPWSGNVLVPLNTRLTPPEYAFQLNHARVSLVLADAALAPKVEEVCRDLGIPLWVMGEGSNFEERLGAQDGSPLPLPELDEDDVITINYTSGTTSSPKGVMLTHRNTLLNAIETLYNLHFDQDSVYLHTLPDFHANGWGGVWSPFGVGATHVTLPAVRGDTIHDAVHAQGVTHLCAAPTVLSMITDPATARRTPRTVRVATAGSPPHARTIADMNALGFDVLQVYGLTETSPLITVAELSEAERALPTPERAALTAKQGFEMLLAGEVEVMTPNLTPVPHDGQTLGEIMVRGNLVMKGYLDNPEATARAFEGGWFHSGDVAVVHPDGRIEIRDRNKDVIISGGENISSVEVEGVLYAHPAVREAVVVAHPDEKWGEVPCAFIALHAGQTASPEDLSAHVRQHLAGYKVPKHYIFREDLPKTASGKFQKFLLRNELWAGRERAVN